MIFKAWKELQAAFSVGAYGRGLVTGLVFGTAVGACIPETAKVGALFDFASITIYLAKKSGESKAKIEERKNRTTLSQTICVYCALISPV